MFANLDRQDFIRLLQKLGSESDAEVLSAARDLHAKVTVAGVAWDELLAPDARDEADDGAVDAAGTSADAESDVTVLSAPEPDHGALSDAEKAEVAALIESIGAMKVGAQAKAELDDYKRDLAAGELEQMDLRYLRALAKRLKK